MINLDATLDGNVVTISDGITFTAADQHDASRQLAYLGYRRTAGWFHGIEAGSMVATVVNVRAAGRQCVVDAVRLAVTDSLDSYSMTEGRTETFKVATGARVVTITFLFEGQSMTEAYLTFDGSEIIAIPADSWVSVYQSLTRTAE